MVPKMEIKVSESGTITKAGKIGFPFRDSECYYLFIYLFIYLFKSQLKRHGHNYLTEIYKRVMRYDHAVYKPFRPFCLRSNIR